MLDYGGKDTINDLNISLNASTIRSYWLYIKENKLAYSNTATKL